MSNPHITTKIVELLSEYNLNKAEAMGELLYAIGVFIASCKPRTRVLMSMIVIDLLPHMIRDAVRDNLQIVKGS